DLARYLSDRGDLRGAGESILDAVKYARSAQAMYHANLRTALHTMYGLNQADASLPYFARAEPLIPRVPAAYVDAFGCHFSYAHALVNAQRPVDAIAHATRAIDLDPKDPHAQEIVGRAYLDSGDPGRARAAYSTALALSAAANAPVSAYTYFGLGQACLAL